MNDYAGEKSAGNSIKKTTGRNRRFVKTAKLYLFKK